MTAAQLFACAMLLAMCASCSTSHSRNQEGGETHFMKACLDGVCEGGLSCVCGVCTRECTDDEACIALSGAATCKALKAETLVCGGKTPREPSVCDSACFEARDCEALGTSYACIEGRCRPESIASALVDEADAGHMDAGVKGTDGGDASDGCSDVECGEAAPPLVMIVLDTSGSMERMSECACTTAACMECLPNCASEAAERNRWAEVLEALTGTFQDFQCEALERIAPPFTYDADYTFPYHRPSGTQREDGLLRAYGERLRFGVATFDGVASYGRDTQLTLDQFDLARSANEVGMWSYPSAMTPEELREGRAGRAAVSYRYPNTEHAYAMNTGIRGPNASSGALIVQATWAPGEQAFQGARTVQAIEETLHAVRPYGSTPTAAALDDIQWLFANDAITADERKNTRRERHLILITDGRPDDDYRSVGCDCFEDGDGSDCGGEPNVPSEMHCPYPMPEQIARTLRCGDSERCDTGLFGAVHVVAFALSNDEVAIERVDGISRAGGSAGAIIARNGGELRAELAALLEDIASGR